MNAIEMLKEMGGVAEPFDLFDVQLNTDKPGFGGWSCRIKSTCGTVIKFESETLENAIRKTYEWMKAQPRQEETK